MNYDFMKKPPYDTHIPKFRSTPVNSSPRPSNLYPKLPPPSPSRHQIPAPPPSSSSGGMGIRVLVKPEYRVDPPPELSSLVGEISRSTFQFDFDFERKILAEAKSSENWCGVGLENFPSKTTTSTSLGSGTNPVMKKYIGSGLSKEAIPQAIANYGDVPTKEFVNGHNLLREMGFSSSKVNEALAMYDDDTDKALAYLLSNTTHQD